LQQEQQQSRRVARERKHKHTHTHTHNIRGQSIIRSATLISQDTGISSESIIGKGKEELEKGFKMEARNTTIDRSN
jgi:hypothetical protein